MTERFLSEPLGAAAEAKIDELIEDWEKIDELIEDWEIAKRVSEVHEQTDPRASREASEDRKYARRIFLRSAMLWAWENEKEMF